MVRADVEKMAALVRFLDSAQSEIYSRLTALKAGAGQAGQIRWDDARRLELEEIVDGCMQEMERIADILSVAQNYIKTLIKALLAYEEINISSQGSQAGGTYSSAPAPSGSSPPAFSRREEEDALNCHGISSAGGLSGGYKAVISQRFANARPSVRNVFERFSGQLRICDVQYPVTQTAHYSPGGSEKHPRGVYYNAMSDMNNPRGAGTTYFHELAHMTDHAATGFSGNLSNTEEFSRALMQDGENVIALYEGLSPERQEAFLNRLCSDQAHSLSDLLGAVTGSRLCGRYGHSPEYWQRPGNLQAEAFAHFFEASMGGGIKLRLLQGAFPNAFAVFDRMIGSLQPA